MVPGVKSPVWAFWIARSADVVTATGLVAELLPGTGSGVVPETVAVLVIVPVTVGAMCATTVICGATPPAVSTVERVQVNVCPVIVAGQVQPVPAADTYVVPAGSVSDTVIVGCESDGPLLRTPIVQVVSSPAIPGPACDLVIARSALVVMVAVSVVVLFAGVGSYVRAFAVAPFTNVVPLGVVAGIEVRTVMTGNDAPEASVRGALARAQLTTPETGAPHVHPVPDADTKPVPGGSVSVITNGPTAVSVPLFLTVRVHDALAPATTGVACVLMTWRSALSMRVCACTGPLLYGPVALRVAPVASSPDALARLICGIEAPTPGAVTTLLVGRSWNVMLTACVGCRVPRSDHTATPAATTGSA